MGGTPIISPAHGVVGHANQCRARASSTSAARRRPDTAAAHFKQHRCPRQFDNSTVEQPPTRSGRCHKIGSLHIEARRVRPSRTHGSSKDAGCPIRLLDDTRYPSPRDQPRRMIALTPRRKTSAEPAPASARREELCSACRPWSTARSRRCNCSAASRMYANGRPPLLCGKLLARLLAERLTRSRRRANAPCTVSRSRRARCSQPRPAVPP